LAWGPSSNRAKLEITIITVLAEAELDIAEASAWYEEQRSGLGDEFLDEVSALFERLAEFPLSYPIVEPPFGRALLRRFPYAVYFLPENERVQIFAVLHQRREPGAWKERFGI
jgi:plasmid stabilization system protein ParE